MPSMGDWAGVEGQKARRPGVLDPQYEQRPLLLAPGTQDATLPSTRIIMIVRTGRLDLAGLVGARGVGEPASVSNTVSARHCEGLSKI